MKSTLQSSLWTLALISICSMSCSSNNELAQRVQAQQLEIDSLKLKLAQIKPGLGEIMTGIQNHHAKLWFAGVNQNWKLAGFELDEIKEMVEMARNIETDRPEIKSLPLFQSPLDSLAIAINKMKIEDFMKQYGALTSTCNECHQKNNFAFNVIKVPTAPPVTNQEFKP